MIPYTSRFLMAIRSCARQLSTPQLALLQYLAGRADEAGECWPLVATIATDLGLSDRQIRRTLDGLASGGWIVRSRIGSHGQRRLYKLNMSIHSTLAPRLIGTADRSVHCNPATADTSDRHSGHLCPLTSNEEEIHWEETLRSNLSTEEKHHIDELITNLEALGPVSRAILIDLQLHRSDDGFWTVPRGSIHPFLAELLKRQAIPWLALIDPVGAED